MNIFCRKLLLNEWYSRIYIKDLRHWKRGHYLRHSHASMLIELGFSPLEISNRPGHESAKKTLETPHRIWYIERKEGCLLVTGIPQKPHSKGGVSQAKAFISQWETPILVATGWALFFSLLILISVEKGKQRYNKATKGNQQADPPL